MSRFTSFFVYATFVLSVLSPLQNLSLLQANVIPLYGHKNKALLNGSCFLIPQIKFLLPFSVVPWSFCYHLSIANKFGEFFNDVLLFCFMSLLHARSSWNIKGSCLWNLLHVFVPVSSLLTGTWYTVLQIMSPCSRCLRNFQWSPVPGPMFYRRDWTK